MLLLGTHLPLHYFSNIKYYLFPNRPLLLYLPDLAYGFLPPHPPTPVQNPSASPGSTSITFIKPSMIPSARCNHTSPIIPEDFYPCFSSRTHTHHFLSCNTVFSQITKNPYLVHPIISMVPYINLNHSLSNLNKALLN